MCINLPIMHIFHPPSYVCLYLGELSLCNVRVKFYDIFHSTYKGSQKWTLPCATNVFLFSVWFQRGRIYRTKSKHDHNNLQVVMVRERKDSGLWSNVFLFSVWFQRGRIYRTKSKPNQNNLQVVMVQDRENSGLWS